MGFLSLLYLSWSRMSSTFQWCILCGVWHDSAMIWCSLIGNVEAMTDKLNFQLQLQLEKSPVKGIRTWLDHHLKSCSMGGENKGYIWQVWKQLVWRRTTRRLKLGVLCSTNWWGKRCQTIITNSVQVIHREIKKNHKEIKKKSPKKSKIFPTKIWPFSKYKIGVRGH